LQEFGVRWLFFFQDTNALAFFTMPCTAAICMRRRPHMVSATVRRRPHEAVTMDSLDDT
jgi:singapore isolate B (sub-type 7) whole genome shotgun sequence assembly, scaffold_1